MVGPLGLRLGMPAGSLVVYTVAQKEVSHRMMPNIEELSYLQEKGLFPHFLDVFQDTNRHQSHHPIP